MPLSSPPTVVSQGVLTAEYAPGAFYGPRTLHDFEFVWLLAGSATWRIFQPGHRPGASTVHQLRPGMLALSQAGQRDHYAWDPAQLSRHSYVHFHVHDYGGLPPAQDWPTVRWLSDSAALEGLTNYLVELSSLAGRDAQQRCDQVLGLLVDVFVTGPFPVSEGDESQRTAAVVRYLEQVWSGGIMRNIPVTELAQATHVSSRQLFRLFEENYSSSPARTIELLRLARAAVLLQRSNLTIKQVAARTGFANPYHFSARFARTYDRPPGAFRAQPDAPDPLGPVRLPRLLRLAQHVLAAMPGS